MGSTSRFARATVAVLMLWTAAAGFGAEPAADIQVVTNRSEYPFDFEFRASVPGMTAVSGVTVGGFEFETNSVVIRQGPIRGRSFVLFVRCFETTAFVLPPLSVRGSENGIPREVILPAMTVAVSNLKPPPDGAAIPSPIEDIYPIGDPTLWIVLAVLVAVIAGAAVFAFWVLPILRRSPLSLTDNRDPYADALAELSRLYQTPDSLKSDRDIYLRVWEILRKFLQRIFHFPAREMATSEIRDTLRGRIIPRDPGLDGICNQVLMTLRLCDRVKYAKHRPTRETTDNLIRDAFEIVRRTKEHFAPPPTETADSSGRTA